MASMMELLDANNNTPALVDHIFSCVKTAAQQNGVIDFEVICSAFEALLRVEIHSALAFDAFEREMMQSLYNQQPLFCNQYMKRHAFLNHVDGALRFIFWHNVHKFHAKFDTTPTSRMLETYQAVAINLRLRILQAPHNLNALIDAEYAEFIATLDQQRAPNNDYDDNNNINNNNNNPNYSASTSAEYQIDFEMGKAMSENIDKAFSDAKAHLSNHISD
jgi:hypothetical protein